MSAYLVDTNILLRWLDASDSRHTSVHNAIETLENSGHTLCITAQSILEFWAVASRPALNNGFGWDLSRCAAAVPLLLSSFDFLSDIPTIFEEWQRLTKTYAVSGVQVHDTRLVAVMKAHGVDGILTFNPRDFRRFAAGENIIVIEPEIASR